MRLTSAESNSQICINSLFIYRGLFEIDSTIPDAHQNVTVHVTVPERLM